MGAQALSPITTPSPPTDRTDSDIPKDPIRTSERSPLPPEPTSRADEMTATVTPVGLLADASTLAAVLTEATDRAARGRAHVYLNRCCLHMGDSIRQTQRCDCGHHRYHLEVLHRPEGLSVRVDPLHLPQCRALTPTDEPPPADHPPPAS